MIQIGVAAYSGSPGPELVKRCEAFVDELVKRCGRGKLVLLLGGYWGLMRCVVDRALGHGVSVALFPPLDREDLGYPEGVIIVRTSSGPRLRSIYLVRSSDVLVALGGGAGTLQEIVTAYTEAKPVYVLAGTGLATDKARECIEPYIDERRTAPITFVEDPVELAHRVCIEAKMAAGRHLLPQRG